MREFFNRSYLWLTRSANHWFAWPFLFLISLLDVFILIIPSEPFFAAAVVGSPKKYIRFSLAMILGRLAAILVIYAGAISFNLETLHHNAIEWGFQNAWDRCEHFFGTYGALSLGVIAVSPFPMLFVIVMASVAGESLIAMQGYAAIGLVIRYSILSYIVLMGRRLLLKTDGP